MATCSQRASPAGTAGAVPAGSLRRSRPPRARRRARAGGAVAALARELGSPIVELTVRADNPAQDFYQRTASQPLPQCLTYVLAGARSMRWPRPRPPRPQSMTNAHQLASGLTRSAARCGDGSVEPRLPDHQRKTRPCRQGSGIASGDHSRNRRRYGADSGSPRAQRPGSGRGYAFEPQRHAPRRPTSRHRAATTAAIQNSLNGDRPIAAASGKPLSGCSTKAVATTISSTRTTKRAVSATTEVLPERCAQQHEKREAKPGAEHHRWRRARARI